MGSIWNALLDGLEWILRTYEGALEPVLGQTAWGVAIILLTITVRVLMIPLTVRQVRSMRATQKMAPELKKINEKYKVDRSMMKTDPERYRKIQEKKREATMALYQEHGANPVGGCLPLILQMPVFFALFRVLQSPDRLPELQGAPFLGIPSISLTPSEIIRPESGDIVWAGAIVAVILIGLQVVTTYFSSRQMTARNSAQGSGSDQQQQAQKMMMYVMPPFLGFLSFTFPIGVVLYWTTTNLWTIGQQTLIFRKIEAEEQAQTAEREQERMKRKQGTRIDEITDKSDDGAPIVDGGGDGGSSKGGSGKGGSGKGRSGKGGSTKGGRGSATGGPAASGNGSGPSANGAPGSGARDKGTGSGAPKGGGGTGPGQRTTRRGGSGQPNRRSRSTGR